MIATCNPPCQNNGACIGIDICYCIGGNYTGAVCSLRKKLVKFKKQYFFSFSFFFFNMEANCNYPFDCHHGGTCIAPQTCNCTQGWEGMGCLFPINPGGNSSVTQTIIIYQGTTGSIFGLAPIDGVSGDTIVYAIISGVLACLVCYSLAIIFTCLTSRKGGRKMRHEPPRELDMMSYD